ncbi:MAG TPA: aldolase, partial [Actinomycetes bacterium]|nr:aldolase [Actinomycetes bacterium]
MPRLDPGVLDELDRWLAPADAELAARYPGEAPARQPVHTVYVPADQLTPGVAADWGGQALAALDRHAGDPRALAAATGLDERLVAEVHPRVLAKLAAEPVEDLRIDFEDGYGPRPPDREDADAVAAAGALAAAVAAGSAPPHVGLRIRSLEAATRRRGLRTLDLFLGRLLATAELPDGFVVTLPKPTDVRQVEAMAAVCERLEQAHGLGRGRLRFELQVETPQSVVGADGTVTVARMLHAAGGRCAGLHYGTYDYSAACGIAAAYQSLDHPAADHAKAVMQVAAAGTGVRLSDGSTNVLPVGDTPAVHAAWRLHARLVRRSLERGFWQGWDLHPAQLPTRYLATYAFFREGLAAAAERLRAYAGRTAGGVLDEPATARALAGFVARGLDCGALDLAEVVEGTGLDRAALDAYRGAAAPRSSGPPWRSPGPPRSSGESPRRSP